jgi:hypothetical protein
VFAQVSALPGCGCVDCYKCLSFWKFIHFRRAPVSSQPSPCDEEQTHTFSTWTVIEGNDGDSGSSHSVLWPISARASSVFELCPASCALARRRETHSVPPAAVLGKLSSVVHAATLCRSQFATHSKLRSCAQAGDTKVAAQVTADVGKPPTSLWPTRAERTSERASE